MCSILYSEYYSNSIIHGKFKGAKLQMGENTENIQTVVLYNLGEITLLHSQRYEFAQKSSVFEEIHSSPIDTNRSSAQIVTL